MTRNEVKNEERLLRVLDIVTDWLRFAESKNAALIGFDGASIYGITQALGIDFIKRSAFWSGYAVFVLILLVLSAVSSLVSFVPKLKPVSSKSDLEVNDPNCLYFEHLKDLSEVAIIQAICESDEVEFSRFEKDAASQIKHFSNIVSEKYVYFTIAVWITVCAYITPIIAGVFAIYLYQRRQRLR
jgi:hypothetical protein